MEMMMGQGKQTGLSNQENMFMGDSSLLKEQPKPLMVMMLEESHNITSSY